MAKRINAHDLAPGLLQIISEIDDAEHPIPRREMVRRYSGKEVTWLIDSGYLAELTNGHLKITELTDKELKGYPPWLASENRVLTREWQRPKAISQVAEIIDP